ncbi:MAG: MucB/RseB C-terminal domain-containing protein [Panacagrimonas sp.]
MRSRLAVLAAAGLMLSAQASAADDTSAWLAKMSNAARGANYQGVLVYRGDDMLETFRVTHRFSEGAERERVQSLTGEVREVLKHNDNVTCLLPKDQRFSVSRPTPKNLMPALTPERLVRLTDLYELRELGEQRVAGRICRGIAIAPRDEFRYGYEIWADAQTAVPLKVSLLAAGDKLLEQMFFTEVEFPTAIPDSAFVSELEGEAKEEATYAAADAIADAHQEQPVSEAPPAVKLTRLPPGFRVVRREIRSLPEGRGLLEHVVLSDGLSAVSVFRARQAIAGPQLPQRLDQMGAVNAYSRVIGRMRVTVVGEAPRQTVQMIGDGFEAESLETSAPAR